MCGETPGTLRGLDHQTRGIYASTLLIQCLDSTYSLFHGLCAHESDCAPSKTTASHPGMYCKYNERVRVPTNLDPYTPGHEQAISTKMSNSEQLTSKSSFKLV